MRLILLLAALFASHLYRPLEQPGENPLRDAHARIGTAVRAAYSMPSDADPLAFLLELI